MDIRSCYKWQRLELDLEKKCILELQKLTYSDVILSLVRIDFTTFILYYFITSTMEVFFV